MQGKKKRSAETLSILGKEYRDIDLENIEDEFNLDHIPLIDYESKEHAIFGDMEIDEDEESIDELDVTKIYENELNLSDDEIEKINEFEKGMNMPNNNRSTLYKQTENDIRTKLNIELNSDVGNDICRENIKKIYRYLEEDAKTEITLGDEIEKIIEFAKRACEE